MELSEFLQIFYNVYRCGTRSRAKFVDCVLLAGLVSDAKKDELTRISRKQKEEIFSGKAKPDFFASVLPTTSGLMLLRNGLMKSGKMT